MGEYKEVASIVFDIDGTLADCRHRLRHIQNGARDWPAFFGELDADGVIAPIRDLLLAVVRDGTYSTVLCSGRPEDYREQTEQWLLANGIKWGRLYMRPADDTRADHVVKRELLDHMRDDGWNPFLVIDDRQSVVDMWRENGLLCLQCAPAENLVSSSARLTLMVGPSGAGKSHWLAGEEAKALGIHPSHVLSSDQMRADLCGDFRDQSRNEDAFAALHAQAVARLKHGLPVVIDATNIRRKDRMTAVALVPVTAPVTYIVINRPIDRKRLDGGWRNEIAIDLIGKHDQTFHSQIKDILAGDNLPNVRIIDKRAA